MQMINASVGDGGTNKPADTALVQALLVKIQRPAGSAGLPGPYLDSYDGDCGDHTKKAIRAFQADHVFVNAARTQSVPNPNATAGQVKPNDATWVQLLAKVPPEFKDLRVLPGGKTVYLQAAANELQAKLSALATLTFTLPFRAKVQRCINRMHELYGIAVGVCPKGDRRDFQTQYALFLQGPGITSAGPGESNHNYGMATDMGFAGLRWLHANGGVDHDETPWLHHLTAQSAAKALVFWEALRTVGTSAAVGAFRGPLTDRPHVQNWDDSNVTMGTRLAALLQLAGTMKWSFAQSRYHCDLGLGGAKLNVGTAAQIWNLNATLTPVALTQARNAAAAAQNKPVPAAATDADVATMCQLLRRQFELADARWQDWTPH